MNPTLATVVNSASRRAQALGFPQSPLPPNSSAPDCGIVESLPAKAFFLRCYPISTLQSGRLDCRAETNALMFSSFPSEVRSTPPSLNRMPLGLSCPMIFLPDVMRTISSSVRPVRDLSLASDWKGALVVPFPVSAECRAIVLNRCSCQSPLNSTASTVPRSCLTVATSAGSANRINTNPMRFVSAVFLRSQPSPQINASEAPR